MVRVTVFVTGFAIFFANATTLLLALNINSSAAHFVNRAGFPGDYGMHRVLCSQIS